MSTAQTDSYDVEMRYPIAVPANGNLMIDILPYSDIVGAVYAYTSNTVPPGGWTNQGLNYGPFNQGDFNAGTTCNLVPTYLSQKANAAKAGTTPARMRTLGFCVEMINTTQLQNVNGVVRCQRSEGQTSSPLLNWSGSWAGIFNSPKTVHTTAAKTLDGVCITSYPTDDMAQNFYGPALTNTLVNNAPVFTQAAVDAWRTLSYGGPTTAPEEVLPWASLRIAIENPAITVTAELVIKLRCEFVLSQETFEVGSSVRNPVGSFLPVMKEAAVIRDMPILHTTGGNTTRTAMGYVGVK